MKENWKSKLGIFFTSQAISLFGSALVQYAIIWYITLKTGSGWMLTLSTLCAFIPQVIISFFSGVWADKYNKKMLIILSDGMIAVATFIIAVLFLLKLDFIWLLFIVLAIRSLGSGIQTPTTSAIIPEIVPENQLMRANGINSTIQSVMLIISPAASGALLANLELEYIFFIDVITALIGITILSFMKIKYPKKKKEKIDYFASIKEGISYTRENKLLSRMIYYLLIANILVAPLAILTPLMVTRTFGNAAWYLTLNEIVFFVGNILGGILISTWGGFTNRIKTICLGSIACGIGAVLLGMSPNFIVYLIFMGLTGVTMPFFNTPFMTIFQETVDSDKQGRVFSLVAILSGSVMPLSMIFYGPAADFIKIQYLLIIIGILLAIVSVFLLKDKIIKKIY